MDFFIHSRSGIASAKAQRYENVWHVWRAAMSWCEGRERVIYWNVLSVATKVWT